MSDECSKEKQLSGRVEQCVLTLFWACGENR